jgi:hypothetical protein
MSKRQVYHRLGQHERTRHNDAEDDRNVHEAERRSYDCFCLFILPR